MPGCPRRGQNVEINGFEVDVVLARALRRDRRARRIGEPRTQVDDRIRDAALRAAGYIVLRFAEDDLNFRPA